MDDPLTRRLVTLGAFVLILYVAVALSVALHEGWDQAAPLPDPYHAARSATLIGLRP